MAAFSPLTTWLESSSYSMLWGEIHGGGLGDGGRACGWDWIFGPILNDAEVHIAVRTSAEPLRTGQLGAGNASISIQAQGALRYESDGRFPVISWLEQEGATRIFPISQGGGLGDGGFYTWTDWIFGNPISMEGDTAAVRVIASGTLHLGIIANANMPITVSLYGDLLAGLSSAIWDTEYRGTGVVLSDGYLSATAPLETYRGVRCKKSHTSGKYYFEFTRKTVPTSEGLAVGLAQSTTNIKNYMGEWYWIDHFLYNTIPAPDESFTWDQYITSGVNAIAVDLDAGKIWFYSGTGAVWHNSGNPAAGTNPTFTNVFGTLHPTFNSGFGSTYNSAVTANFGATAFTHSIPSGFEAWNATDPLIGDCPVTLSSSATLTVTRTLLGTAGSSISIETSGTLTTETNLVFSGNLGISLESSAELSISRTWLGNASTTITFTTESTLTQQTTTLINASLTFSLQGQLGETNMSFQFHEVFYETDLAIFKFHEISWCSLQKRLHQVSWKSDTTQRLHDISWSFSALALHTALYESLISQEAWTLHESAWASAGGLTATFEQHDTSWASVGSLSAAFEQHDTSWASITTSAAQTQHNATWASVGGLTAAWNLHPVSWASVGGLSAAFNAHSTSWSSSVSMWNWVQHDVHWGITSAFAFHALSYASSIQTLAWTAHETHWNSVGSGSTAYFLHEIDWQSVDAIQALHLSFWKSIQAKHRFHSTTWAMQATNERFHEVRYRSNQTTPTLLSGSFYVRV